MRPPVLIGSRSARPYGSRSQARAARRARRVRSARSVRQAADAGIAAAARRDRRGPRTRLTARARALLTVVNLHYAGVAALLVIVLYMAAHLLFVSQSLKAHNADALNQQRVLRTTARRQAQPVRGSDSKIATSTEDADAFYTDRLPCADS
mgnify:CR=1 FL=1